MVTTTTDGNTVAEGRQNLEVYLVKQGLKGGTTKGEELEGEEFGLKKHMDLFISFQAKTTPTFTQKSEKKTKKSVKIK